MSGPLVSPHPGRSFAGVLDSLHRGSVSPGQAPATLGLLSSLLSARRAAGHYHRLPPEDAAALAALTRQLALADVWPASAVGRLGSELRACLTAPGFKRLPRPERDDLACLPRALDALYPLLRASEQWSWRWLLSVFTWRRRMK